MNEALEWNLTESEIALILVAANTNDSSDEWLAELTGYAESTIRSMFGRIEHKIEVHTRGCAILEALRVGLVKQEPALYRKRELVTE